MHARRHTQTYTERTFWIYDIFFSVCSFFDTVPRPFVSVYFWFFLFFSSLNRLTGCVWERLYIVYSIIVNRCRSDGLSLFYICTRVYQHRRVFFLVASSWIIYIYVLYMLYLLTNYNFVLVYALRNHFKYYSLIVSGVFFFLLKLFYPLHPFTLLYRHQNCIFSVLVDSSFTYRYIDISIRRILYVSNISAY